jgi:hypothetical protein
MKVLDTCWSGMKVLDTCWSVGGNGMREGRAKCVDKWSSGSPP